VGDGKRGFKFFQIGGLGEEDCDQGKEKGQRFHEGNTLAFGLR
jgi:hypothetical protein